MHKDFPEFAFALIKKFPCQDLIFWFLQSNYNYDALIGNRSPAVNVIAILFSMTHLGLLHHYGQWALDSKNKQNLCFLTLPCFFRLRSLLNPFFAILRVSYLNNTRKNNSYRLSRIN